MAAGEPKKIVILGGGFAGVSTAMELGRRVSQSAGVEVHLVSDENYFVFQPLLPEVVACGIEPSHILNPIRQLCPAAQFHCAEVQGIDTQHRVVSLVGADKRRERTLRYDHLVLCMGLVMDVSRIPGMAEHSLPIKTLGDAFHLRNHVLSRLEEAEIETDEMERRRLLTVVAVGGGFSGVETIAEINDMLKSVVRFYPRCRATGARMVLVHSRDRILNELHGGLAAFAQQKLMSRGVELILNSRVAEATPSGVVLSTGQTVPTATVICTVGNAPHPLLARTAFPQTQGRLVVDNCLRVQGHENVWAFGDAALVPDVRRGEHCPPTAQYALRQGTHCARNILAALEGRVLRPFEYGGLGQLAVVGRRCGVAQIMGWRIAGLSAWFLWRAVYFMKLPGLRCKLRVGLDWALDLVFPRDITKLAMERTERLRRSHFQAGDTIIRQGELGDRFYVIESGQVEILREEAGLPAQRLATRSAGESFGEVALLRDTPRTASVRCLTAVDVISFTREDFRSLVASHTVFRTQVERDLQDRTPGAEAKEKPSKPDI